MRILFILAVACLFSHADAAYYYVNGTTGNDTLDGSSDTFAGGYVGPKKTMLGVMSVAAYQDTVEIANGHYDEYVLLVQSYYFLPGDSVSFRSMEMNGPGEHLHLIGGVIHFTDSLVLNDGWIHTRAGRLIASDDAKVYGGSKTSFVDGPFTIENDDSIGSGLLFPIGEVDTYRPVILAFNQTTTDTNSYTGQLFRDTAPPGTIPDTLKYISVKNHWFFTQSDPTTAGHFQGFFAYDTAGNDDEVTDPANLRLAYRDAYGTAYKNLWGAGTGPYVGTILNSVIPDSLGYFVLANPNTGSNPLGHNTPAALFSYSNPCERTTMQFTDESVPNTAPITVWHWDFGTGDPNDTSALQHPAFLYDSAGNYTAKLSIIDSLGYTDSLSMDVKVNTRPTAAFSGSSVCLGDSTDFQDMSTMDSAEVIVSRLWTLNTGVFHYDDTFFRHKYPTAGTFNPRLVLYTANNCTDTTSRTVAVYGLPAPSFTASGACLGDTTIFTGSGGLPGDTVKSWKWFIDNSLRSTSQNFRELQATAKTYNLMLAVMSQNNCPDTVNGTFAVYENPVASFALDNTVSGNDSFQCFKGNEFTLISYSYFPPAQTSSVNVYWGSPRVSGGNTYNFTSAGLHPVELVIKTDKGCMDSSLNFYRVYEPMTVNYNVVPRCIPLATKFSSTSTAGAAGITNYHWEFGDLSFVDLVIDTVDHAYVLPTIYDVQLTITSGDGCVDSTTKFITVDKTPAVNIAILSGTNPFCAGDSLVVQANGGNTVVWDDGMITRQRTFLGSNTRIVTAFSLSGCSAKDTIAVVMNALPVANAGPDTSMVQGTPINLNGSGGVNYQWSPAALAASSTSATTQIDIPQDTLFILTVTDSNGCSDKDSVFVRLIIPAKPSKIPNLITPNGDFLNDAWDLSSIPNIFSSSIRVFDNYGKQVWNLSKNYMNNWKGTSNQGKDLPDGTYLYIIQNDTDPKIFKGYLQILR